jgi:glycosyltransferase involved in cell wall biosynthesis
MWGVDLTHTAHTGAQTGIQQVCRELADALCDRTFAGPLIYDPFSRNWRPPDQRERRFIGHPESFGPVRRRSSRWTLSQKLRGCLWRWLPGRSGSPGAGFTGLLVPEIFGPERDRPIRQWPTPKAAVFYDAIPVLHPEWTPGKTVRRFPAYLRQLARFDQVYCISEASRTDLRQCWEREAVEAIAETRVVPLGLPRTRLPDTRPPSCQPADPDCPVLLMVGTLEARKNHLALLDAAEVLWSRGQRFNLRLVGMLNRETGEAARMRIQELQARKRPLEWLGPLADADLRMEFLQADAFVYPSRYEGFGIPVIEALSYGLPCVVARNSALAELGPGGGIRFCGTTPESIAEAIGSLLDHPQERLRLRDEARRRPVRTMADAAADIRRHLRELAQGNSQPES